MLFRSSSVSSGALAIAACTAPHPYEVEHQQNSVDASGEAHVVAHYQDMCDPKSLHAVRDDSLNLVPEVL